MNDEVLDNAVGDFHNEYHPNGLMDDCRACKAIFAWEQARDEYISDVLSGNSP